MNQNPELRRIPLINLQKNAGGANRWRIILLFLFLLVAIGVVYLGRSKLGLLRHLTSSTAVKSETAPSKDPSVVPNIVQTNEEPKAPVLTIATPTNSPI